MHARSLLTRRFLISVTTRRPPEGTRLRPVPVVLVETDTPSQLSEKWQDQLGKFGFKSAVASLRQSSNDAAAEGNKLLDTWYQELRGQAENLRDFPPIIVAHGHAAWRVCQKYVANQSVTGLVYAAGPSNANFAAMPKTEFEPYFPLAVVAKESEETSEEIEHLAVSDDKNQEEVMKKAISWIEECF